MDADAPLPVQGFEGKLVEHNDWDTMTGDWQEEFSYGKNPLCKICADHPDNDWCQQKCEGPRMKHRHHHHHDGGGGGGGGNGDVKVVKEYIPGPPQQSSALRLTVAISSLMLPALMLAF